MPKKGAFPQSILIEGMQLFRNEIIKDYGSGKRIAFPSDSIWNELSIYFSCKISAPALYLFVMRNSGNVQHLLGFIKDTHVGEKEICIRSPSKSSFESGSDEDSKNIDTKNFIMTLSPDEWFKIEPCETFYRKNKKQVRSHMVLPRGEWTHILADLFWEHTHLQCCLSFKRAKVFPSGQNYIIIIGRCKVCRSNFKGVIDHKPAPNSRVFIECKYEGNFHMPHDKQLKRRMTNGAKKTALVKLLDEGKSADFFREEEAVRLMELGDHEPPVIPSGNSLRIAKSKELALRQRSSDHIKAVMMMKLEDSYKHCIHNIGLDPFYVHFHVPELLHLYRAYCKSNLHPSLIVDATGSVIKRFSKFGLEKTRTLLLYDAIVYDDKRKHSFTVCSMISEEHDNISIYHWLSRWLKTDVPSPKETCSDMSIALLSALVRSFTQYTTLYDYIGVCAQLIFGTVLQSGNLLPRCFVRIDVAHFIKNVTKWSCFTTSQRHVKEVYLRVICHLIKSKSVAEIRSLLVSIFIVASNETDQSNIETGEPTACQIHKLKLLEIASSEFIHIPDDFNDFLANSTNENLTINTHDLNFGLGKENNQFTTWAENIYSESKEFIEEGSGLNPLVLPSIIPFIIKSIKMLPLWSGIMIPIFGYGSPTKSSAAVESMFHKTKNIVFKDIDLPTNLETFIERRLISLKGSALLKTGERPRKENEIQISPSSTLDVSKLYSMSDEEDNLSFSSTRSERMSHETINPDPMSRKGVKKYNSDSNYKYPLCSSGQISKFNDKSDMCDAPVHTKENFFYNYEDDDTIRICDKRYNMQNHSTDRTDHPDNCDRSILSIKTFDTVTEKSSNQNKKIRITNNNDLANENEATENWNRQKKKNQ